MIDADIPSDKPLAEICKPADVFQLPPNSGPRMHPLPQPNVEALGLLASPKSSWQELPVPEGPDKHEEFFEKAIPSHHKLKLIGARVRGKSHKHAGTNCDDWFEFDIARDWTIMAVADGVGSRKLSRVGAKEACRGALSTLREDLPRVTLTERTSRQHLGGRGTDGKFSDMDMDKVEQALFRAMDAAYHALEAARDARKDRQEYIDLLGHNPEVSDFSTTLLLAVHNCFILEDRNYDFIMSLQVGDGMIAAVNIDNKLVILGKPDTGEFAGQVMPITNIKIRDDKEKRQRVFTTIQRLKAVMLMTDGVADDYFPNDPGMLRLYEDLVKEGIVGHTIKGSDTAGGKIDQPVSAQVKLRRWLDSYHVKGSFDDRTLVVLYREENL